MNRVYRADVTAADLPRRPLPERQRAEAAELVEVRGLLCELRPGERHDPAGPLSWSPLTHAPEHHEPPQGALARRIRVQTSVGPSDGPKDAFASLASVSPGVESDAREEPARVLTWLQRSGTVADGLPALCVAAAVALAPAELAERWARLGAVVATERRRQWGLSVLLYALRWWRGERPVCCSWDEDCEGVASGAGCWEVAARCQRPETMRVRGPRCRRCA
jgi:hypothetical protein